MARTRYVRNLDTQVAVTEFETRTGLKVLSVRNRNKGSMKPYIYFRTKKPANWKEIVDNQYPNRQINGLPIEFIDSFFYTAPDEWGLDVRKSAFKNVKFDVI